MPSNKKPAKKRRLQHAGSLVGDAVLHARPMPSDVVLQMQIMLHDSIVSLCKGDVTPEDISSVSTALGVARCISEAGYGAEYLDQIRQAQFAHRATEHLYDDGEGFVYSPGTLALINEAVAVYDAQLSQCPFTVLRGAFVRQQTLCSDPDTEFFARSA